MTTNRRGKYSRFFISVSRRPGRGNGEGERLSSCQATFISLRFFSLPLLLPEISPLAWKYVLLPRQKVSPTTINISLPFLSRYFHRVSLPLAGGSEICSSQLFDSLFLSSCIYPAQNGARVSPRTAHTYLIPRVSRSFPGRLPPLRAGCTSLTSKQKTENARSHDSSRATPRQGDTATLSRDIESTIDYRDHPNEVYARRTSEPGAPGWKELRNCPGGAGGTPGGRFACLETIQNSRAREYLTGSLIARFLGRVKVRVHSCRVPINSFGLGLLRFGENYCFSRL